MSPIKCKGYAALDATSPVAPYEYEMTPVKDNEIVIKVSCCGICHSDIHTIDSGWGPTDYPCVPGHEIIGKVIETGSKAKTFKVGDRVGVGAMVLACLECKLCRAGYDNLCQKRVFTYNACYEDGSKTFGGYADHIKVNESWAFEIPSNLTDEEAAPLLCAGATVYSPLKRFNVGPGMKVGVIGIGGLGHLAVQFAAKMGAEVTCISTSASKEGATHFYNVKDESQHAKYASYFDIILNSASGGADKVSSHLNMLVPHGTLILLGVPEEKMSLSAFEFVGQHRSITGSLIGSIGDIKSMLNFASKHGVKPWIVVKKMSEVNEGIAMVRTNQVKYRVVLKN